MNCKKNEKLLYLKEDELTAAEIKARDNHLAACPVCSEKFKLMLDDSSLINRISAVKPFLTNEENFTDFVMMSIEKQEKSSPDKTKIFILEKFSILFQYTAVRAAAVFTILLLVSTFLLQNYFTYTHISSLENRFASDGKTENTLASLSFDKLRGKEEAAKFKEYIKDGKLYTTLSSGLILADKEKLDEFLKMYSSLQIAKSKYATLIEAKYPALNEFLNKNLSVDELQNFLKKNKKMIDEIISRIAAGEIK